MAYLMDVEDLKRPAARVVCRELLASCVLRPLMQWCVAGVGAVGVGERMAGALGKLGTSGAEPPLRMAACACA